MAKSPQPSDSTPAKRSPGVGQIVQDKFGSFLNSLGDLLLDITALEVNTMVVANISGHKFVPEEAYEDLYDIPSNPDELDYFKERGIPTNAEHVMRYCTLRRKLDVECRVLVEDGTVTIAPEPTDPMLDKLIGNPKFLRFLRKLSELKSALDSDDPHSKDVDLIYAQTVVQLDGDIINRFNEQLFAHPSKEVIMKLHNDAVVAGEKQWHGLLGFMVNLIRSMLPAQPGSNNISLFPPQNGKQ